MHYAVYFVAAVAIAAVVLLLSGPYLQPYYAYPPMPYLQFRPHTDGISVYAYDASNRSASSLYFFVNGVLKNVTAGYGYVGEAKCGDRVEVLYTYADGRRWTLSGTIACAKPLKAPSGIGVVNYYVNPSDTATYVGQVATGGDKIDIWATLSYCDRLYADAVVTVYFSRDPLLVAFYRFGAVTVSQGKVDFSFKSGYPDENRLIYTVKLMILAPPTYGAVDDFLGGVNYTITVEDDYGNYYVNGNYVGTCKRGYQDVTKYYLEKQEAPANATVEYVYKDPQGNVYKADAFIWKYGDKVAVRIYHSPANATDPGKAYVYIGDPTNYRCAVYPPISAKLVFDYYLPVLTAGVPPDVICANAVVDAEFGDVPTQYVNVSYVDRYYYTVVRSDRWSTSISVYTMPGMFTGLLMGYTPYILPNYTLVQLPGGASVQSPAGASQSGQTLASGVTQVRLRDLFAVVSVYP